MKVVRVLILWLRLCASACDWKNRNDRLTFAELHESADCIPPRIDRYEQELHLVRPVALIGQHLKNPFDQAEVGGAHIGAIGES
jgi:hypothetical protein